MLILNKSFTEIKSVFQLWLELSFAIIYSWLFALNDESRIQGVRANLKIWKNSKEKDE